MQSVVCFQHKPLATAIGKAVNLFTQGPVKVYTTLPVERLRKKNAVIILDSSLVDSPTSRILFREVDSPTILVFWPRVHSQLSKKFKTKGKLITAPGGKQFSYKGLISMLEALKVPKNLARSEKPIVRKRKPPTSVVDRFLDMFSDVEETEEQEPGLPGNIKFL